MRSQCELLHLVSRGPLLTSLHKYKYPIWTLEWVMMLPIDKAKISAAKLRFCFSQFLWFNVSQRRPFPLDVGSLAGKMRSYPSGITLSCVTGLVTASITSYDQTTSCHEPVSMWHWRVHTRLYDQQPRPQPAGERESINEILFWCKMNFRDRDQFTEDIYWTQNEAIYNQHKYFTKLKLKSLFISSPYGLTSYSCIK